MDGDVSMDIVSYDEKKQELWVEFNTGAVWIYSKVDRDSYNSIANSPDLKREIKSLFRNPNILGVHKDAG